MIKVKMNGEDDVYGWAAQYDGSDASTKDVTDLWDMLYYSEDFRHSCEHVIEKGTDALVLFGVLHDNEFNSIGKEYVYPNEYLIGLFDEEYSELNRFSMYGLFEDSTTVTPEEFKQEYSVYIGD